MNTNIEELIVQKVKEIDVELLVNKKITELLTKNIKRSIAQAVNNKIESIIDTEINIIMTTQPIITDDGWNNKKEYTNFEALFKQEFLTKLNSSWNMKDKIQRAVKDHVSDLFKKYQDNIIKYVVEKVTNNTTKNSLKGGLLK